MGKSKLLSENELKEIPKAPTGIDGLDEITCGGLPRGRPTLVCGSAGCGKTLFAMEFLLNGAVKYGEPGVVMTFEETAGDLAANMASLGFDVLDLVAKKKIVVDHVHIERSEIQETGEYDLDGLFVRLGYAIDSIGARRVVLDTIEALFSGLLDEAILRAELRRLFRWLKDKKVTAVITGERGSGTLTRHGLEEYVSDCVILLDHRVDGQLSTRRLRVVKYRGTTHGTNEYPFLIDHSGISVLPITSLGLAHEVTAERISSGVPELDTMLEGKGYFRGSSILVSGTSGTGKTTLSSVFADATCRRGERCLYLALEESTSQIIRNLRSIGLDQQQWVDKGLLRFLAARPMAYGLEMHLAIVHKTIAEFKPHAVVVDPVTSLIGLGDTAQVKAMLTRLLDFIKGLQVTAIFTSLTDTNESLEETQIGISSLMDTWILLRDIESEGERNRGLYILKSRGMAHSNQIREFTMTPQGIRLIDAYLGPAGVLTGSARLTQETAERNQNFEYEKDVERLRREIERKRRKLEMEIAVLRLEFEAHEEDLRGLSRSEESRQGKLADDHAEMARLRHAVPAGPDYQGENNGSAPQKGGRNKAAKARSGR